MISSRAQFGVYGAVVPLVLVVVMYLGFAATGTVLVRPGRQRDRSTSTTPAVGILIFGALTMLVAIVGYRWIHVVGRIATVVGCLGFAYLAVRLFTEYDVAALLGDHALRHLTFLLADLARRRLAADLRPVRRGLLALPAARDARRARRSGATFRGQRARLAVVDDDRRAGRRRRRRRVRRVTR